MPPTIAFFRKNHWPPANVSAVQALRYAYPHAQIDEIDLLPRLRDHRFWMLLNGAWMVKEYWRDVWLHRRSLKESFVITSLTFRLLRRLAQHQTRRHDYSFTFQMQSLFDASTPGVPHFVYTDHTLLVNYAYPGFRSRHLYNRAWLRLEPTIYAHARRIFTRSENIRHSLINDYACAPERVACVHVGCNVQGAILPRSFASYAAGEVLFVGIDWERKGGPELLAAWRYIAPRFPSARLTIVGCSPDLTTVPQARALGRLPLEQIHALYAKASIFCMPTHLEPFGIAVIEAMAQRLPVITTTVGALPEVVQHNVSGLLIEPGTEAQLAWALEYLLERPECCLSMGEAGFNHIQRYYTWNHVGEQLRKEIDHALAVGF